MPPTPHAAGSETLAIVGTGLMGGSLGLASLGGGGVDRVIGYDRDPRQLRRALERRAVTETASSPGEAVDQATLVVISTPVGAIPGAFQEIAPHLSTGTVVTDVGSTKGRSTWRSAASRLRRRRGAPCCGGGSLLGSSTEPDPP